MKIKHQILLIIKDQNESLRISGFLKESGFDVVSKNDPSQGLEIAYELVPDIIICQSDLWPINGYQFLNAIRNNPLTESVHFVMLLENVSKEELLLGLELTVDDFIIPPFTEKRIVNLINRRIRKCHKLQVLKNSVGFIYDNSPFGVFLFNRNRIYKANYTFHKFTKLLLSEVNTISIRDFLKEDSLSIVKRNMVKCETGMENCAFNEIEVNVEGGLEKFNFFMVLNNISAGSTFFMGILIPSGQYVPQNIDQTHNYFPFAQEEEILVDFDIANNGREGEYKNLKGFLTKNEFLPVRLSNREQEILKLSCSGIPIKQIADKLNISNRTVEKHRTQIMEKTGSKNIIEVMLYSLKNSLVEVLLICGNLYSLVLV